MFACRMEKMANGMVWKQQKQLDLGDYFAGHKVQRVGASVKPTKTCHLSEYNTELSDHW